MKQSDHLDSQITSLNYIVNVSQVKQLSPFRYPGGKTWLVPLVRRWLSSMPRPKSFLEPFSGGGIISLSVAYYGLADHCLMVELDEHVAAVWSIIFSDKAKLLQQKIFQFRLSSESVEKLLSPSAEDNLQLAFQTIVKNRTFHGGILAPGSGMIKSGENGKGLKSRWYPKTLIDRISTIYKLQNRITFEEGNAFNCIKQNFDKPDTAFFIDPPYTASQKKAGKRLYAHHTIDHEFLFHLVSKIRGRFMVTYDDDNIIRELCRSYGFSCLRVPMTGTHNAKRWELVILDEQSHHELTAKPSNRTTSSLSPYLD